MLFRFAMVHTPPPSYIPIGRIKFDGSSRTNNNNQNKKKKQNNNKNIQKKIDLSGIDFHFSLLFFRLSLSFFFSSSIIFLFSFLTCINIDMRWKQCELLFIRDHALAKPTNATYTKLKLIFAIECSVVILFFFSSFWSLCSLPSSCHALLFQMLFNFFFCIYVCCCLAVSR